ncbi:unnamed protein product [Penicillium salamii]|uniref:SAM-dependent methyltransferase Erg6/SMT-type domain-containing protein n=1 Tax=Penicillium salamii TaxID=1612424 RepID=A0A9W4N2V0_9EURO|nr:unnamed protein product [Penicillium salamii]
MYPQSSLFANSSSVGATSSSASNPNMASDATSDSMHGNSHSNRSAFLSFFNKRRAAYQVVAQEYADQWDVKGSIESRSHRQENYVALSKGYYDLANDIFEHLWGTSIHFVRPVQTETVQQAHARHEHYLALTVEISHFADVSVTGLNFNDYQVRRAKESISARCLEDKISFVVGDFTQMPFESNTFDAAYSIEGTSYAPDLTKAYLEIYRVLRPGSRLGVYEMVLTDNYDDNIPEHRELRHGIEKGLGLSNLVISSALASMKAAGFEIEIATDLDARPTNDKYEIPWYFLFERSLRRMANIQDTLRVAYISVYIWSVLCGPLPTILWIGEILGIFVPGTREFLYSLVLGFESMERAGKMKLFTPMFLMVARKPLE